MLIESYNRVNSQYYKALNQKNHHYKIKLELLTNYETTIGEIVKDVGSTADGQININYQQLVRRSCSLHLINVDNKYAPDTNNGFWFHRKFKLWIGVATREEIFWFSQGVYVTKDASGDVYSINIEGIDKGGLINGDMKRNMLTAKYVIEVGSNIAQLIKDTLAMNITSVMGFDSNDTAVIGNTGEVLDNIAPLIDKKYFLTTTQNEISVDSCAYLGDLFIALGEGYNADVYYDTEGHFRFSEIVDANSPNGYVYMHHDWEFSDDTIWLSNFNMSYQLDGINAVTVYTNTSDPTLKNVSYTAYNNNPLSPLRTKFAGIRRLEPVEISYINVSEDEMLSRCKQYANYLLLKQSMIGLSASFQCPILPHLDVNRTIGITSKAHNLDSDTFVVQSITIPLSSDPMSVTATNVNWLPSDMSAER